MAASSDGGSLWLRLSGAVQASGLGFYALGDVPQSVLRRVLLGLRVVGAQVTR